MGGFHVAGGKSTRIARIRFLKKICYEENLSMARGKPQQKEMTAEINSILKYAI
jgi:hypothetical protein